MKVSGRKLTEKWRQKGEVFFYFLLLLKLVKEKLKQKEYKSFYMHQ